MLITTLIILVLSVGLSIYSLRKQGSAKELKKTKRELKKSRVIYQRDSSL